jgi:hypothetical protein
LVVETSTETQSLAECLWQDSVESDASSGRPRREHGRRRERRRRAGVEPVELVPVFPGVTALISGHPLIQMSWDELRVAE